MPIRVRATLLGAFIAIEAAVVLVQPRLWWLPLAILAAALAFGLTIRTQAHLEGSVTIDRPPDQVWAFVTDPGHIPLWNRRIAEVRLEEPLPLKVGSIYRYEVVAGRRRIPCRAEVVEREELVLQRTRAMIGSVLSIGAHRLEAAGGATRLTATTVAHVPLLQALVLRQVGGRRVSEDLAALKRAAEAAGPS